VRTVSPEQQRHLLSTFRVDPQISFVAAVPVNPVFFDPVSYPKPDDGIFRIGWFGRLHRERGFDEWIARVHDVARDLSAVELHIIGDGPDRQDFKTKIEEAFPNIKVVWWGQLSGKSLAAAVSGLDLLINSVRNETFGRAMLEAVLQGVRVEAIDSPGIRSLRKMIALNDDSPPEQSLHRSQAAWLELSVPKEPAIELVQSEESVSMERLASSWLAGDRFTPR
jgi:glycosyltransferase involved in cell wall biosynthesis